MLPVLLAVSLSARAAEPDLSWLVGQWRGGEGAVVYEECWHPALGGAMLGTFRYVDGDAVRFYELMTLGPAGPEDPTPALRIKHFGPDLVGWEAQDAHVGFRLSDAGPDLLVFTGVGEATTLRYRRAGDQLTVTLEKEASTSTFTLSRVP